MDSYKAAAKTVRVDDFGNHAEVWIEEIEGAIRTFYIAPGSYGIGIKIFDSVDDFLAWERSGGI